jgi:lipoate-protein ligase B
MPLAPAVAPALPAARLGPLVVRDLGLMRWDEADRWQKEQVKLRQAGAVPDQLLFVQHPHTVTLGRNAKPENVLMPREALAARGVEVFEANRGGDVTYHGPGQIIGYPIIDLNGWKRDVHLYVRALEEAIIRVLAGYGIQGERSAVNSGVWVAGAKICALGIHISRWVTSHGFALNHTTDLSFFGCINPCGLGRPVTSLAGQGVEAERIDVVLAIAREFGEVFGSKIQLMERAA